MTLIEILAKLVMSIWVVSIPVCLVLLYFFNMPAFLYAWGIVTITIMLVLVMTGVLIQIWRG